MNLPPNRIQHPSIQPLWRTLLLLGSAALAMHSTQAATIYQCKQASGKVAFQEMPCAHTDTQAEVGKTTHAAPPPAHKAKPATKPEPASAAAPASSADYADDVCRQTGVKVFDTNLPQHLQHPQAGFQACKKTVPDAMKRNGACLDACVQAWMGEYKKKFVSAAQ